MRILLSTIGSRGDVQPLVALALQLRALEQDVRLCVPPDFQDWIEGLGFPVVPIGPELPDVCNNRGSGMRTRQVCRTRTRWRRRSIRFCTRTSLREGARSRRPCSAMGRATRPGG